MSLWDILSYNWAAIFFSWKKEERSGEGCREGERKEEGQRWEKDRRNESDWRENSGTKFKLIQVKEWVTLKFPS